MTINPWGQLGSERGEDRPQSSDDSIKDNPMSLLSSLLGMEREIYFCLFYY